MSDYYDRESSEIRYMLRLTSNKLKTLFPSQKMIICGGVDFNFELPDCFIDGYVVGTNIDDNAIMPDCSGQNHRILNMEWWFANTCSVVGRGLLPVARRHSPNNAHPRFDCIKIWKLFLDDEIKEDHTIKVVVQSNAGLQTCAQPSVVGWSLLSIARRHPPNNTHPQDLIG